MSDKVKVKLYECKYFEADIDDLSRNYWCKNSECPTRECWCDHRLETLICPGFEKSDSKPYVCEFTEKEIDRIQSGFVNKIITECSKEYGECDAQCDKLIVRKKRLRNTISKLNNWRPHA